MSIKRYVYSDEKHSEMIQVFNQLWKLMSEETGPIKETMNRLDEVIAAWEVEEE